MTHLDSRSLLAKATLTGVAWLLLAPVAQATEVTRTGKPTAGEAGDFALKVEPGVAIPRTRPQPQRDSNTIVRPTP
jgi:hypothetical protein